MGLYFSHFLPVNIFVLVDNIIFSLPGLFIRFIRHMKAVASGGKCILRYSQMRKRLFFIITFSSLLSFDSCPSKFAPSISRIVERCVCLLAHLLFHFVVALVSLELMPYNFICEIHCCLMAYTVFDLIQCA